MRKLIIFDLDGTLLDTLPGLASACDIALSSNGYPCHSREEYGMMLGSGIYNFIRNAVPARFREDKQILAKVREDFLCALETNGDGAKPYPGVPEMLGTIRKQGIMTAILSNKPHVLAEPIINGYFPGLIDLALGQRDGVPIKPDPSAVFEIIERLGVAADECAYVGDSDVDMATGAAAGIFTVGVTWGYRTRDMLEKEHPSVIVDEVCDLLRILVDK